MLNIKFVSHNRTIPAEPGETIREAAIRSKLSIYPNIRKILNCRGRGLCSSCKIEIVSGNVGPLNEIEKKNLAGALKKNPNLRLACQIQLTEEMDGIEVRSHV
ncbi:MAG: (2Fe-2S)-binding protein [Candidatus Nitrohelix vancouverensis]|uniref:(2Fe-2S)-binding protein n=1 Tax=Candidatus Nitrohelix vancouverensis TaxID=2705534 RepID=A0A7T0C089_9BACT|nr:MAG: (2Fe-2S)-binding protein [Candidatus Nitrohelix vancouverensis]